MTERRYRVAAIPGDGIGTEILPPAMSVLDQLAADRGFALDWTDFPWSCSYYKKTGQMMPTDALQQLAEFDCIFLSAVGAPGVPDHISLWGLLIPIRRTFDLYVNLRPTRLLPGIRTPLAGVGSNDLDLLVVRENTEGEYSEVGGRSRGPDGEYAVQQAMFTRTGCERIVRYACERARAREGRLAIATKSNGIVHTMPFWDDVSREVVSDYPDLDVSWQHVDALAARLISHPATFDVILGTNLFADILSDMTAAIAGSLGIAPSANINPEGRGPAMFEPVHGSAPDIAGQGIANPIGQIWTGALMLEHLGEDGAASQLMAAIETVTASGPATPDMGGTASTLEVAEAVRNALAATPSAPEELETLGQLAEGAR